MVSIGYRGLLGLGNVRVEILGSLRCNFGDVGVENGRILLGFFDTVVDTMGEGVEEVGWQEIVGLERILQLVCGLTCLGLFNKI